MVVGALSTLDRIYPCNSDFSCSNFRSIIFAPERKKEMNSLFEALAEALRDHARDIAKPQPKDEDSE